MEIPFKKEKYERFRQKNPDLFKKKSFRTVPFHHADYRGDKFQKYYTKGSGAKAIVGKDKKTGKWKTQSILIPKNNPTTEELKTITNYQYLLGDFDKDRIKNIDDRYPFKKSTETVEETKLSTSVEKSYRIHRSKKRASKSIISDFRKLVRRTRRIKSKKELEIRTSYRTKRPISLLNKAYDRGLKQVKDLIGVLYVGKNQKDLESMENHIQKKFDVQFVDNYYRDPRPDGYKGINIKVIDPKTKELFEIQLKTKRIKRLAHINHPYYKAGKSNAKEFKRLVDLSEKADNGDKKTQQYIDNLSRKEIEKYIEIKR